MQLADRARRASASLRDTLAHFLGEAKVYTWHWYLALQHVSGAATGIWRCNTSHSVQKMSVRPGYHETNFITISSQQLSSTVEVLGNLAYRRRAPRKAAKSWLISQKLA